MTIRIAEAQMERLAQGGRRPVQARQRRLRGAYSFPSRFENGPGTNPEELIAAAHAGCFSMALASLLEKEGIAGVRIRTTAKVHLGFTAAGPTLTRIELETEGEAPASTRQSFEQFAETAKLGCLVSRALAAVSDIRLQGEPASRTRDPEPREQRHGQCRTLLAATSAARSATTAEIMRRFNDAFLPHDPSASPNSSRRTASSRTRHRRRTAHVTSGATHASRSGAAIATAPGHAFRSRRGHRRRRAGDHPLALLVGRAGSDSVRGVNLMRVRGNLIVEAMGYVKGR